MSIIEKPPLVGDGLSELCQAGSFDNPEVKRSHQKPQIKYQGPAEAAFDTEIALALAASHWRTAALFLHLTAKYAEAGDYLSLDGPIARRLIARIEKETACHREIWNARQARRAALSDGQIANLRAHATANAFKPGKPASGTPPATPIAECVESRPEQVEGAR
jgi:hypothetical protein